MRRIAALVLNSFGVLSHYDGTQKGGGPRIPSYTTVFVEGYERFLDGINASFCVCVCAIKSGISIIQNQAHHQEKVCHSMSVEA